MKSHYPVVVIGSGYGGGIAASRLSRAGISVCVLERGRELHPGEYPDTPAKLTREVQAHLPAGDIGSRTGLYDFHVAPDINVLVGCGLGGTSLINAGVTIRPDPRVFKDPRWPAEIRNDLNSLEDGIERAEEMLKPVVYPDSYPKLAKDAAHEKSAKELKAPFIKTPLHIVFEDGINHVGVEQKACVCCGDCVTGCNYGSKSTTLMNYLPDARNHGAQIFTGVSVRRIERQNNRWAVHYLLLDSGKGKLITADLVVVAAGTLGSTEVLLRSKRHGLSASDRVGYGFTGNGDALGYAWNCNDKINGIGYGADRPEDRQPVGPFNTTLIDLRDTPRLEDGIALEEGAIPGPLAQMSGVIIAAVAPVMGKDTDPDVPDTLVLCGPHKGAMQNTQTYLVMSHDDGQGRMYLKDDRLRIDWPGVGGQPNIERLNQKLLEATKALGGTFVPNPSWSKLTNQNLTTVHPLGGCVMAERAEDGVVNHKGQVFSGTSGNAVYDSLLVCDGSIVPRPLGINPLLTISALAERAVALVAKDRGWKIDYELKPKAASVAAAATSGSPITQTMKGNFSTTEKRQREVTMGKDGTLILELLDTSGKPLGEDVDVRIAHRVLTDNRRFSNVKASPLPKLTELHRTPQGLYTIEIDPPSYRCVRHFVNIRPSGDTHLRMVFPIDPRKVRDLKCPDYDALSADLKRILESSSRLLGFSGKIGRELYEGLDSLRKAGIFNIAAKAAATTLPGGTTVIQHIQEVMEARGDRFFAVVSKELREETRNSVLSGLFEPASSALHHPPAGYAEAGSYKSDDRYGNLQLTFFVKGSEWVADIDIDDASGLQHIFQVVRNAISGPTHPYDIREILLTHQQLDAGYTLVV